MTCSKCKFYDHEFEHENEQGKKKYGFCFRYPPLALAENKSTAALVQAELRACGEFKPKPAKHKAAKRK
ncbi:hypothetical protein ACVISU_000042 [Bradyrhizobium sp. USDA 4452]